MAAINTITFIVGILIPNISTGVFIYKEKKLSLALLKAETGTSLVVQWLKPHPSNAGGLVRSLVEELKIPHAAWHGQNFFKKLKRVSWDEVREWHGHIYTTKCKTDS